MGVSTSIAIIWYIFTYIYWALLTYHLPNTLSSHLSNTVLLVSETPTRVVYAKTSEMFCCCVLFYGVCFMVYVVEALYAGTLLSCTKRTFCSVYVTLYLEL